MVPQSPLQLRKLGGMDVPLNIFLFQEIQRLQRVIEKVRGTLTIMQQAIRGEVVMTSELLGALDREKLVISSVEIEPRSPLSGVHQSIVNDELGWDQGAEEEAAIDNRNHSGRSSKDILYSFPSDFLYV